MVEHNFNLINKKVLIVDEVDDTGTTLKFCIENLKTKNQLNDCSVFVIHNKQKNKNLHLIRCFYHACCMLQVMSIISWDSY